MSGKPKKTAAEEPLFVEHPAGPGMVPVGGGAMRTERQSQELRQAIRDLHAEKHEAWTAGRWLTALGLIRTLRGLDSAFRSEARFLRIAARRLRRQRRWEKRQAQQGGRES